MISRLPRYRLTFGYVLPQNEDRIMYGKLDERIFTFNDLEYFLKILSPINSINWIPYVRGLCRGGEYTLKFDETTDYGTAKKVLKITRN